LINSNKKNTSQIELLEAYNLKYQRAIRELNDKITKYTESESDLENQILILSSRIIENEASFLCRSFD
jgi:hypothetical protein